MDQDYVRTGTAIGSRASHEHYLKFLVASVFDNTGRLLASMM